MPVNQSIPSSFGEIREDFATVYPILFIMHMYSWTCFAGGFRWSQDDGISDATVLVRW